MGALAAIVSKCGENVVPYAVKMLSALKHRGSEAFGLSTDRKTVISGDIKDLDSHVRDEKSIVALGYNFRHILPEDEPQPIEAANFKVVFEGRIFSPPLDRNEIFKLIEKSKDINDVLRNIITEMRGSFIIAILNGSRLLLGREIMGATPLYFYEGDKFLALASERKALWLLKIKDEDIKSFPPGSIAEISSEGAIFRQVKVLGRPRIELIKDEMLLDKLHALLLRSIKEMARSLEGKISVAFSGGLDSSVIAALMKKSGIDALLVSVGLEGSRELEHAERVAGEIGLPIMVKEYTLEDVRVSLPKVLWLIEEANALKAAICIPELWAAEEASKMGCKALFYGHGGDEIFGGYYKYLREYRRSPEEVESALYQDTLKLHEILEASEKICSFNNIEARFPYVDYDLVLFALSIPVNLKIMSEDDPLRKRILRKFAKQIDLPLDVCLRPKKAIQYGTGTSKALKKIAKKNGLNVRDLVKQVFRRIYNSYGDGDNLLA